MQQVDWDLKHTFKKNVWDEIDQAWPVFMVS